MKRRAFLLRTSQWLFAASLAPGFARAAGRREPLDRIAMGTVIFRHRFPQTRPRDLPPPGGPLSLFDVPAYYRDRFRLRQVEFWSHHFESLDPAYLRDLRRRLDAAGSSLVDVQVDADYNLASPDEAERRRSLALVREWIDGAAALGSQAVRVNPGNGPVEASIRSLREVNLHARKRGLPLLIENHFGIEMDPDVHLRLLREAGPDNIHALPDFGNYPDDVRYAALEKILPHAHLISAKAVTFNARMEHVSYDFDRCVQMAERAGFRGIYSVEQWSREYQDLDYDKVADWLIERVSSHLA